MTTKFFGKSLIAARRAGLLSAIFLVPVTLALALNYASTLAHPAVMSDRIADMFSKKPRNGLVKQFEPAFDTCQMYTTILAGPTLRDDTSLVRRMLLHRIHWEARAEPYWQRNDYCSGLYHIVSQDREVDIHPLWHRVTHFDDDQEIAGNGFQKFRYWHTQKSVLTLLLTRMTTQDARTILMAASYLLCIAAAGAAFLTRKPEVAATLGLLCLSALLLSALPLWGGFVKGLPFTVCVAGIFGFTILMLRERRRRWAPYWCFGFGVTAQVFWYWDYTTVLAPVAIAVTAYFWRERRDRRETIRAWLSAICWSGCYLSGWLLAFVGGLLARSAAKNPDRIWEQVASMLSERADRYYEYQFRTGWTEWFTSDVGLYIIQATEPSELLAVAAMLCFIGVALYVCIASARQPIGVGVSVSTIAWRVASDATFLLALIAFSMVQMAVYDDVKFGGSRFMFVPLALSAAMALMTLRHVFRAAAQELRGIPRFRRNWQLTRSRGPISFE